MNEDLVLAITMLIILAVVVLFIQISQQIKVKRIQKMKIQRRFGEIPDMEEILPIERISVYHKHQGREDVDQVTWSDLSMDQVFQRIDQCDSAAGEAVLYNMLHCTDNGQAQRKELLKYYEEQAEPRKKAEAILISLGKREGLYYLPEYVDTLQASHVGSVFFYRLLQILLLGSVVGGLWNVQILPLAGVMAIVNIAVYIMTRMKYEQHMSMMELIVLVGITLWQLISYEKSVKWLENKRESYLQLFEEIGRLDAAISIASFRKSLPFYTEPEFHSERSVHMEEMYHPLIEEPVSNSMDWSRNCIITGSNASGKSTWIKAVAINLILAQTICTCTAKRFQMHPGQIMTSMAVRDDIMKGESYFLKAMKYLRRMLESFSEEKLTICIIDEILKGTNTKERIAASKAILDYMQRQNCLVMVASHDYELTVLLEGTYENYHFTERIGEDDIYFDYRLYPGAVTSGNAIKLLKFMKFPEEIVTEAKQQVTIELADLQ